MILACIAPVGELPGDDTGGEHAPGRGTGTLADATATASAVSPELAARFRALIDEVTDELMRGSEADGDRAVCRTVCRADAIALLLATSGQLDDAPVPEESPLTSLLLEEQQRAAAFLAPDAACGRRIAYLKA